MTSVPIYMPKNQPGDFPTSCPIYHNSQPAGQSIVRMMSLRNVEEGLELDDELPLVVGNFLAVVLLETIDTSTRDLGVKGVFLLQMTAVGGLVTAHFNLDGHGGLTLFADGDLLVITLD